MSARGPGNGPEGAQCPNWSLEKDARCCTLMSPTGPKLVPTGEVGVEWTCHACGYAVTVYREVSRTVATRGADTIVIPPGNPALGTCQEVATLTREGRSCRAWCTRGHNHPMPHIAHGLMTPDGTYEVLHAWVKP